MFLRKKNHFWLKKIIFGRKNIFCPKKSFLSKKIFLAEQIVGRKNVGQITV